MYSPEISEAKFKNYSDMLLNKYKRKPSGTMYINGKVENDLSVPPRESHQVVHHPDGMKGMNGIVDLNYTLADANIGDPTELSWTNTNSRSGIESSNSIESTSSSYRSSTSSTTTLTNSVEWFLDDRNFVSVVVTSPPTPPIEQFTNQPFGNIQKPFTNYISVPENDAQSTNKL